jgi:hypothetical protein
MVEAAAGDVACDVAVLRMTLTMGIEDWATTLLKESAAEAALTTFSLRMVLFF